MRIALICGRSGRAAGADVVVSRRLSFSLLGPDAWGSDVGRRPLHFRRWRHFEWSGFALAVFGFGVIGLHDGRPA